jgi:hypothetical protein
MIEGELPLEKLVLSDGILTRTLDWKITARPDSPAVKLL